MSKATIMILEPLGPEETETVIVCANDNQVKRARAFAKKIGVNIQRAEDRACSFVEFESAWHGVRGIMRRGKGAN